MIRTCRCCKGHYIPVNADDHYCEDCYTQACGVEYILKIEQTGETTSKRKRYH